MSTFQNSLPPALKKMIYAAAIAVYSASAASANLSIPDSPLPVLNNVQPNIMLMLDNSGSMSNLVPDAPYDSSKTYATCPAANLLTETTLLVRGLDNFQYYANATNTTTKTNSTLIDLVVLPSAGTPKIGVYVYAYVSNNNYQPAYRLYDWGTGAGKVCFQSDVSYTGLRLNADGDNKLRIATGATNTSTVVPTDYRSPTGYSQTPYSGNYLNWYFNTASIAGDSTNYAWASSQRTKPIPTSAEPNLLVRSRIQIARDATVNLVNSMDSRLRVGYSNYNSDDGGLIQDMVETLGDVGSSKRSTLVSHIQATTASGSTPLAETLSDIGRYFAMKTGTATDDNLSLSLYPRNNKGVKPTTATTATVKTVFNSHSFKVGNSLTLVPPVTQSCQSNFAVLLTDGRPNSDQAISSTLSDYDGDCKTGSGFTCGTFDKKTAPARDYEGSGSDYLDDVALALNDIDLRPDYANESTGKQFINNITTYLVGFADPNVQKDPLLRASAFAGQASYNEGVKGKVLPYDVVDDTLQELLIANNATSLAATFKNITADIQRKSASGSSVASNSTRLDTGSQIYIAQFNSGDWSGSLSAYKLSTGAKGNCPTVKLGELCPVSWEASSALPAADKRVIITAQNTVDAVSGKFTARSAVPFQWGNLNTTQRNLLQTDPVTLVVDSFGELRLNWLRGDQTQEQSNDTPQLRTRTSKLGDIVNSDPYFYGPPAFNYGFDDYAKFRKDNASRAGVVYVSANDGMLHGFAAADGKELLAYVPSPAFGTLLKPNLQRLSKPVYDHVFTADGSPTVGDAYFKMPAETSKAWRTVLASGMRSGGQGVFLLDVTDPAKFSEADASKTLLWEFTDADDADLGYTFSQPSIVQMADKEWYALIGSGYNNGEADGKASSTGTGALFLLKLSGPTGAGPGGEKNVKWVEGTDYYKIDLGGGTAAIAATMILPAVPAVSNGVATPIAVDIDRDNKVDYIYVGDEEGNLKRVFVTSANPVNWNKTQNISTLFTAVDPKDSSTRQPITARPEVGFNTLTSGNLKDLVVYFGTGRYIDKTDAEVKDPVTNAHKAKTQSFYAVFDDPKASTTDTNLSATVTKVALTDLQSQRVNSETKSGGTACSDDISTACARTVSSNTVATTKKGWYLNLYNSKAGTVDTTAADSGSNLGERAVTPPTLRNGRIVFTTLIPSSNPCEAGGNGWLMELDAKTGGATTAPPLDINNDNAINDSDKVKDSSTATDATTANGLRSRVGILPRPTVLLFQDEDGSLKEFKLNSGLTGTQTVAESANDRKGRVSWREIIQ